MEKPEKKEKKFLYETFVEINQWKIRTLEDSGNGFLQIAANKPIVLGFLTNNSPTCCAVEELGSLSQTCDPKLASALTGFYIDYRKDKTKRGPGMGVAHFVHSMGAKDFGARVWMDAFLEAGFKQVVPDFENPVHPGNIIRQLVYVHHAKT